MSAMSPANGFRCYSPVIFFNYMNEPQSDFGVCCINIPPCAFMFYKCLCFLVFESLLSNGAEIVLNFKTQ